MKNNLDRYPRSVDSWQHWKFKVLRKVYGWAGEGKFWALNDMIAKSDGCVMDLSSDTKRKAIAADIDFTLAEFSEFLTYLEGDCELIIWEGDGIRTGIVSETLDHVNTHRKRERTKKQVSRGESNNVPQVQTEIPLPVTGENEQIKGKESKVNESKPLPDGKGGADAPVESAIGESPVNNEIQNTPPCSAAPPVPEELLQYPFDTPEFRKAWDDWIVFKKKRRTNYKGIESQNDAMALLAKTAGGREDIAIRVIYYSRAQNYQGLFPSPEDKKIVNNLKNGTSTHKQSPSGKTTARDALAEDLRRAGYT